MSALTERPVLSEEARAAAERDLRATIIQAYREGRRNCLRVGQLLESQRVALGGTQRGGVPVQSRFWRWFEEQDFPFSRKTAENYLAYARDPERYELHCERVRRRSADRLRKAKAFDDTDSAQTPTVSAGLPRELYERLKALATRRGHGIDRELEEAVEAHLRVWER